MWVGGLEWKVELGLGSRCGQTASGGEVAAVHLDHFAPLGASDNVVFGPRNSDFSSICSLSIARKCLPVARVTCFAEIIYCHSTSSFRGACEIVRWGYALVCLADDSGQTPALLTQSQAGGVNVNRNSHEDVEREGYAQGHAEVESRTRFGYGKPEGGRHGDIGGACREDHE